MTHTSSSSPQTFKCSLHDWGTLRSQLLFIFDSPLPPGSVDGVAERHGEYSAWLVRRGTIHVEADGDEVTVRPGQWLFCFAKRLTQKFSPDIHLLSLRFSHGWPDENPLFFSDKSFCLLESSRHPRLEAAAKNLMKDVGRVEWRREHPAYTFLRRMRLDLPSYLRYQGHLLEWTGLVAGALEKAGWEQRIPTGIDSRLAAALFLLDNLPLDAPFPRKTLLNEGALSLGQLNRMCVKACGLTLLGYWESRKVQYARLLLEQSRRSVKEIASELGFSQLSHFSAWFKRHTSQSPRAAQLGQSKSGDLIGRDHGEPETPPRKRAKNR